MLESPPTTSCPAVSSYAGRRPSDGPPQCPYCRGLTGKPVYENVRDRLGYAPGAWSFWQCEACGSASIDPMPKAEELAGFYPSVYSYSPRLAGGGRFRRFVCRLEYRLLYGPVYRSDARRIARGIGDRRGAGKRLLDVGCGRGVRLPALRDLGYDVVGADFQPDTVRSLQEEFGIPAVCCDVGDLTSAFPPSSFDVVVAYYVLEHVVEPVALVRDCLELVKPGGWLVLAVPLADSLQAMLFGARWVVVTEAPRHVTIPSRRALRLLARTFSCDQFLLAPDSARSNAANIATTLLPNVATPAAYGVRKAWTPLVRLAGTAVAAAALPWCWLENVVFRRPGVALAYLRKPEGRS